MTWTFEDYFFEISKKAETDEKINLFEYGKDGSIEERSA